MTTATVKARQTVYDIALEQYGTCEAVGEILALNPQIANDPEALVQLGSTASAKRGFTWTWPLHRGHSCASTTKAA